MEITELVARPQMADVKLNNQVMQFRELLKAEANSYHETDRKGT